MGRAERLRTEGRDTRLRARQEAMKIWGIV
jgi:hypothetical protein